MAKKRRRKPGLQRCLVCGSFQLLAELERGICLTCLGLVATKQWRSKEGRSNGSEDAEQAAAGATAV